MPSILITAVASSTLTAPAHGLNTGDGPLDLRNLNGLLPAPLTAETDLYAIFVDANNIKVATTSANALANTFITLTTSGTGKNYLEYGIPYRRARTYVAGSQVKSLDLDAFQDTLIALHQFLTLQPQTLLTNVLARNRFPVVLGTATGWAYTTAGAVSPAYQNTATGALTYDLDVPQGYKLGLLKFGLACPAASPGGALVVTLQKALTSSATAPAAIATYTVANGTFPAAATDQVLNLLAQSLGITVTVAAAGGTYTRSAGSFLTDGFFVGQQVTWSGFVNGGNNVTKTITALTATVMTVSTAGLVNEAGGAGAESVIGVSPVVDDTFGLQLVFSQTQAGGNNVTVGMPRCTMVTQ